MIPNNRCNYNKSFSKQTWWISIISIQQLLELYIISSSCDAAAASFCWVEETPLERERKVIGETVTEISCIQFFKQKFFVSVRFDTLECNLLSNRAIYFLKKRKKQYLDNSNRCYARIPTGPLSAIVHGSTHGDLQNRNRVVMLVFSFLKMQSNFEYK